MGIETAAVNCAIYSMHLYSLTLPPPWVIINIVYTILMYIYVSIQYVCMYMYMCVCVWPLGKGYGLVFGGYIPSALFWCVFVVTHTLYVQSYVRSQLYT